MLTALEEYLQEFDSCKCAPCPNNARPVLSGTECLCVCQTGTYGSNCETRAPDYTSGKRNRNDPFHNIQLYRQERHTRNTTLHSQRYDEYIMDDYV